MFGPLSFQAEYEAAWLQDAGPAFFQGAYAEVHYFLTGEHRAYDHERMAFTRVKPLRPVRWTGCERGCGAWQVAARYSYLNLNSGDIRGGILNEFTLGVNWFLTANAKVQANYVLTDRSGRHGRRRGHPRVRRADGVGLCAKDESDGLVRW